MLPERQLITQVSIEIRRLSRVVSHFSSISRTSATCVGTHLTSKSNHIEDSEKRLAMTIDDMLSPLPRRVSNPRTPDVQVLHGFFFNWDKMHCATSDAVYTQARCDYTRSSIFPQFVRKYVKTLSSSTYQHANAAFSWTIWVPSIGKVNSGNHKINIPITKGEKFFFAELSLLKKFWRNSYAHVFLTAEADSLPTNTGKLLEDCGLVGCHLAKSNDLSVHARTDSTCCVRFLWESIEEANGFPYAAIFEVKFGKKPERALADLRDQTANTFFSNPGSVSIVFEGNDFSIIETKCVLTARYIQETKKKWLVTRSIF